MRAIYYPRFRNSEMLVDINPLKRPTGIKPAIIDKKIKVYKPREKRI